MRRIGVAVIACLAGPAPARADTQARLELEGGTEVDSNPGRNQGPSDPAVVGRAGTRLQLGVRFPEGRSLRLSALAAAKKYSGEAQEEDVGVVSGDLRFDARLGERPFLLGTRATYYDAFERDTSASADDDFRTGDGAFVLTLLADDDQRVVGSGGLRFFQYKPNDAFSFYGEFAALAYTKAFQLSPPDSDEPRSLDLSFQYSTQRRRYDDKSYTNICADFEAEPDPTDCILRTASDRVDVFHAGMVELLYSGARLLGARYEVHVNDSTSFGESLVRHRLELSGTSELFAEVFLTARVLLQFNQFLDPALRRGDTGTFVTIEDEGRNALFLHATRDLGQALTLEARYAFYANAFSEAEDVDYRRHTVYLGLIYGFQSEP